MTDTRVSQINQHLARTGLGCIELDELGGNLAGLIINDSLVFLGDLWSGHIWVKKKTIYLKRRGKGENRGKGRYKKVRYLPDPYVLWPPFQS